MMAPRRYDYIGPELLGRDALGQPGGTAIRLADDLRRWLVAHPEGLEEGATFVIDHAGCLLLAPRRSEHVRCASKRPVLAAGPVVVAVTNQSTGYGPEPESWPAVAAALAPIDDQASRAPAYTTAYIFRRCPACQQINLIKDAWFFCAVCDAPLPRSWNLATARADNGTTR